MERDFFDRGLVLIVLPREVDLADARAIERAVAAIDSERVLLCRGAEISRQTITLGLRECDV